MPKLNSNKEKTIRELDLEEMELASGGIDPIIIDYLDPPLSGSGFNGN